MTYEEATLPTALVGPVERRVRPRHLRSYPGNEDNDMDQIAMWIGYAVMIAAGAATAAVAVGLALNHLWRDVLSTVPSMDYIRDAVRHYKTVKPAPAALADDVER